MIICDFCLQFKEGDKCGLGLRIPKTMSCAEFDPGMEKFCSDPNDFTNEGQIVQMASFFGIRGREMKKVRAMAAQAETRLRTVLTTDPS